MLVARAARADDPLAPALETTRDVATGGTDAIDDGELRRFSYDDPTSVLNALPGVHARSDDPYGLRVSLGIRGTKNVTLVKDGVLVAPAPYSAPATSYFPLMDRMQRVRVLTGPATLKDGPQTTGGVVELTSREIPHGKKGMYDVAYGRYGTNKEHVAYGASDGSIGFLIEGMRLDTTGFQEIDGGGDSGFTRNEWTGKARWIVDPRADVVNELALSVGYADEGSNVSPLGLTDTDFRANPERRYAASRSDRIESQRTEAALTHTMRFSPKLRLTTTVYRNDMHLVARGIDGVRGADLASVLRDPDNPAKHDYRTALATSADTTAGSRAILAGPDDRRFVSQGVQSEVRADMKTGPLAHRITYGVRAHYDEVAQLHSDDGFLVRAGQLVPEGTATQIAADDKAYTYAGAMWATDAVTVGDVTLMPGVRVEAVHAGLRDTLAQTSDGKTYREVLPGIGAHYALAEDFGLFGGVHAGFSPALLATPEESVDYEGGARWTVRHLRAQLVGFYDVYRNLVPGEGLGASRARAGGVEASAQAGLPLPQGYFLPVRASYTFTYTELLATGNAIPYVPPNQASGAVGLEKADWGVSFAGTFVDAMWEKPGQGTPSPGDKTDAYFLVDASARYRLIEHLELYANGRNLTNDRYIVSRSPFGARPGAPLVVLLGARGEF